MRSSVWLLVVVMGLCGGCGAARQAPFDVIQSYQQALQGQRFGDAYALLSAEARNAMSLEDFERTAREQPEELRETTRWLAQIDNNATTTARLELSAGESIELIEEGGAWRLDPTVLDFYGQRTPRQAIRAFARALERRRWEVLMRFAPRRVAEQLTPERLREAWERGADAEDVQRMLAALRQSTERPIEVTGERATMTYGAGNRYTMQLVHEDGMWKVEDPD
ncbi:MAG: hypothetical protein Q8Q09_12370 [Deltaproteobacteria bacterium]|nr:hypothetical protein [Deltaproteobacteria bacterium]